MLAPEVQEALRLIVNACDAAPTTRDLALIGADDLEWFVTKYGADDAVWAEIVRHAHESRSFRRALRSAWINHSPRHPDQQALLLDLREHIPVSLQIMAAPADLEGSQLGPLSVHATGDISTAQLIDLLRQIVEDTEEGRSPWLPPRT